MARTKGGSAVMNGRKSPTDGLDDFPTPPWATRALLEYVTKGLGLGGKDTVLEPACNRGYMVRVLQEYFGTVIASDIHDYGCGYDVKDFIAPLLNDFNKVDWVITNPPFNKAEEFINKSLAISEYGCAMFLRSNFAESVGRYQRLFSINPPTIIAQFAERVVLHEGTLAPKGSTATAYAWFVWDKFSYGGNTIFKWIPPCRKELEKASDYE